MCWQRNAPTRLFGLIFVFALAGCGEDKSKVQSPPKQQVEDAVRASLPPFLSLVSTELEPISTGSPDTTKVNFKATVTPKEDLCLVDREVAGAPRVTLLRVVQAAGAKATLYGSIDARRLMDKWTLGSPQIQVGLEQFGRPRGAFGAQAYVADTEEAKAALRQQAANAEEEARAKKEALRLAEIERKAREDQRAREEKARAEREEKQRREMEEQRAAIAEENRKAEEKRKAEKEAARRKILLATVPGTQYSGTVRAYKDAFMRIALAFGEQNEKESVIRARISNPDNPKMWRNLIGELHFEEGADHPIVLVTADADEERSMRDKVVNINCDLLEGIYLAQWDRNAVRLRSTDDGLEGEFSIPAGILGGGNRLPVRLTRVQGPAAKPDSRTPAPGAADAPAQVIHKGDILVVAKENTPLMSGSDTLATVKAGTRVTALEVIPDPAGSWVKVRLSVKGQPVEGYIHSGNLKGGGER